jgi:hypothetical protein
VAEVAPRPVWGGRTTPITLGGGSTTPNKQNESGLTIPKSLGPKGNNKNPSCFTTPNPRAPNGKKKKKKKKKKKEED